MAGNTQRRFTRPKYNVEEITSSSRTPGRSLSVSEGDTTVTCRARCLLHVRANDCDRTRWPPISSRRSFVGVPSARRYRITFCKTVIAGSTIDPRCARIVSGLTMNFYVITGVLFQRTVAKWHPRGRRHKVSREDEKAICRDRRCVSETQYSITPSVGQSSSRE